MKKKIMVIGAGVYQYPLIETASQYGDVVLVAPIVDGEIMKFVYRVYNCDVCDLEQILSIAISEKIDAVITDQTDIAVRTVAYVAEKMDLPGIGYDTAVLFTDKGLMREKCVELGIPVLPNMVVSKLEEALEFYKKLGNDVILKPVDNQGSRGVQKVTTIDELMQKFPESKMNSRSGKVIIEKLVSGREFVVEGLSLNGKYQTLICGDTDYFDIQDAYAAKTRIFPSKANEELVQRVCELNKKIIEGFGLKQGISHSEFIMDGDDIYLIETAARGGGVFISSDLIYLGSGLETEKFLISIALGDENTTISHTEGKTCGYMAFYLPDGIVESIDGIEEVKALPYVHRNLLNNIYKGLEIKNHLDKTSRFSIIVSADNREQLEERMDIIRNKLDIKTRNKNGLNSPIWS